MSMFVENKGTTSESSTGAESPLPGASGASGIRLPNQKDFSSLSHFDTRDCECGYPDLHRTFLCPELRSVSGRFDLQPETGIEKADRLGLLQEFDPPVKLKRRRN